MKKSTPVAEQTSQQQDKKVELNNVINFLLQHPVSSPETSAQIGNLLQLMLWAERKSPEIILNIMEMGVLEQIISLQTQSNDRIMGLIKGVTLLYGNCVEEGLLISYLLKIKYGDTILKNTILSLVKGNKYHGDELTQYFGSFLKAYAKHFSDKTAQYYVRDNECLLAEVCCHFFNCPQQLTRTSVTNILLSVMGSKSVEMFIYGQKKQDLNDNFYLKWAHILTVRLRNQLICFNNGVRECSKFEIQRRLQQLNDTIILWEDLTAITIGKFLFQKYFLGEVLCPILVGSMSSKVKPVFSLKFTLIILGKLLPVISNLGLMEEFGRMLFSQFPFEFPFSRLETIDTCQPFDITQIIYKENIQKAEFHINEHRVQQQGQSVCFISGLNEFLMAILKSKDNQFITIVCNFVGLLLNAVRNHKQNPQLLNFYRQKLNLSHVTTNKTYNELIQIFISQLIAPHSISTLRCVCRCILTLQMKHRQDKKSNSEIHMLHDDNKNSLLWIYKSAMKEIQILVGEKQNVDYITETFEYDMKFIESLNLYKNPLEGKVDQMQAEIQIFSENFASESQEKQNQDSPFYESIPDTPGDHSRYKIVKFLLIRKLRYELIQTELEDFKQQQTRLYDLTEKLDRKRSQLEAYNSYLLDSYYRNVLLSEGKIYKPGQILRISSIKHPLHPCKLVQNKTEIDIALIDDQISLIIGFIDKPKGALKIMMNIKIKHVSAEIRAKGDKMFIEIIVRTYDHKTQRLIVKSSFCLRGFQMGRQYIPNKRNKFRQKQLTFLTRLIKKCESDIPQISLI